MKSNPAKVFCQLSILNLSLNLESDPIKVNGICFKPKVGVEPSIDLGVEGRI